MHAFKPRHLASTALFAAALIAASGAFAADDKAEARYKNETAKCASGQSQQDKATCMQEAGAARDEARKGRLDSGPQSLDKNATARCKALPATERSECEARMAGQGTTSGSVNGGGVSREMTTTGKPVTVPAKP